MTISQSIGNLKEIRFLHLEDNKLDAQMIQLVLNQLDTKIKYELVDNESDFKKALKTTTPDIVLSDMNLPDYTGLDALEYLNSHMPQIPVIVITGSIEEEVAARTIQLGAWDYVVKERLHRLPSAVENVMNLKIEKEKSNRVSKLNQNILETTPSAVFTVDTSGTITSWNKMAETITGFMADDIIGENCKTMRSDICINNCLLFDPERPPGPVQNVECDFLDVHGNKQFILKNADLLFNAKGEIIGGIESFVDQSEKVKMTKELQEAKNKAEESDRLKTAFLANISHEIRTPLNAIIGFSELIADSENEHDAKQGFFEIIKSGSDQLLSILDKIMQLSLIEGGDVKIDHKVFDLNILVKGILQQHKTNISSKKLKLSLVQPEELSLNSDSTRISLIIDNLMENAVKFTDEGEIGFGYEANNDSVMFFISDTGCGIPANIGDKIFERFYRVKDPAHLTPGSGLGLPISKALVEALGGKIWYESEENKGTCFYFKIPNLYIKESINPITYSVLHMPSNQFG